MKLQTPSRFTSFYESFSDLIFATMAIFVLLMLIYMVHINLDTGLEEVEQQIEQEKSRLEETLEQLKKEQEERDKLERSKKALEEYNLEIVIAVDTTGSMQLELNKLTDTIGLIGKVLPKIANTVKIGVIGYRRDEQDRKAIQTFPLKLIQDPDVDRSQSYRQLHSFVGRLQAQAGSAPVEEAIDMGIKMFSDPKAFVGHQTFMLLGDVGPYEDRYRDQIIDERNRQQEAGIIRQIKLWATSQPQRKVLVLFSGEDEIAKTSGAQHQKFLESRELFKKIAAATGDTESYTNNPGEMIPNLLAAALQ